MKFEYEKKKMEEEGEDGSAKNTKNQRTYTCGSSYPPCVCVCFAFDVIAFNVCLFVFLCRSTSLEFLNTESIEKRATVRLRRKEVWKGRWGTMKGEKEGRGGGQMVRREEWWTEKRYTKEMNENKDKSQRKG